MERQIVEEIWSGPIVHNTGRKLTAGNRYEHRATLSRRAVRGRCLQEVLPFPVTFCIRHIYYSEKTPLLSHFRSTLQDKVYGRRIVYVFFWFAEVLRMCVFVVARVC